MTPVITRLAQIVTAAAAFIAFTDSFAGKAPHQNLCAHIKTLPDEMLISHDGKYIYIADSVASRVLVASLRKNSITSIVPLSGSVGRITANSTGNVVFVTTNADRGSAISVIDVDNDRVVRNIPLHGGPYSDIAVSPDGNFAYLLARDVMNAVVKVKLSDGSILASTPLGGRASQMAFDARHNELYVTGDMVWEIAGNSLHVDRRTNPRADLEGITINAQGTQIASVAPWIPGKLYVVPLGSRREVWSVSVGALPTDAVFSPDGRTIYVTNMLPGTGMASVRNPRTGIVSSHILDGPGTVSVIDVTQHQVMDTFPVGRGPRQLAISPDGNKIYTILQETDGPAVAAVDISRKAVSVTIPIPEPALDKARRLNAGKSKSVSCS